MPRTLPVLLGLALLGPALAGCLSQSADPRGEPGSDSSSDPAVEPGDIVVEIQANRSAITPGETVAIDRAVRNTGNGTAWYDDACGVPWNVTVRDPEGEPVETGEDRVRCGTLVWTALQPGERLPDPSEDGVEAGAFAWNGTRWNASGEGGRHEPVEPGNYTVEAAFPYAPDQGGAVEAARAQATVQVRIADPGDGEDGDGDPGDGGGSPGIRVHAEANRSTMEPGETVAVNLTAENGGSRTVEYRSGCAHTWNVTVEREDGEAVQVRRPRARCLGFTWERMEPGEVVPYPGEGAQHPFVWNGTVWNGSAYEPAEPGNYTIRGTFPYRAGPDGETLRVDGAVEVTLSD